MRYIGVQICNSSSGKINTEQGHKLLLRKSPDVGDSGLHLLISMVEQEGTPPAAGLVPSGVVVSTLRAWSRETWQNRSICSIGGTITLPSNEGARALQVVRPAALPTSGGKIRVVKELDNLLLWVRGRGNGHSYRSGVSPGSSTQINQRLKSVFSMGVPADQGSKVT